MRNVSGLQIETAAVWFERLQMDALLKDYFARTVASEGIPPLDMDWERYAELQHHNKLILVTAREDMKLVGFVMYFIIDHLHHKGLRMGICDILAVHVDHRGKRIGRLLVQAGIELLKARDVKAVIHNSRTVYDVDPLFPKLGFELVEHSYMKRL